MATSDMNHKVILITGANSGIGLAAAGQLGQLNAKIVITTRTEEKAQHALKALKDQYNVSADYLLLELDDFDSIRRCAEKFKSRYDRLDVLVNNAGLNLSERQVTKHWPLPTN